MVGDPGLCWMPHVISSSPWTGAQKYSEATEPAESHLVLYTRVRPQIKTERPGDGQETHSSPSLIRASSFLIHSFHVNVWDVFYTVFCYLEYPWLFADLRSWYLLILLWWTKRLLCLVDTIPGNWTKTAASGLLGGTSAEKSFRQMYYGQLTNTRIFFFLNHHTLCASCKSSYKEQLG